MTPGHRHETKEDPEVIKQWKEAQIIKLEAKDREEEKAKQVLKLQAKKELEDWYKLHSEQVRTITFQFIVSLGGDCSHWQKSQWRNP